MTLDDLKAFRSAAVSGDIEVISTKGRCMQCGNPSGRLVLGECKPCTLKPIKAELRDLEKSLGWLVANLRSAKNSPLFTFEQLNEMIADRNRLEGQIRIVVDELRTFSENW